jgi:hypothetical protein
MEREMLSGAMTVFACEFTDTAGRMPPGAAIPAQEAING